MGDERDVFWVVRKGDMIGVYKSLSDLQALLRSSVIQFIIIFLILTYNYLFLFPFVNS